LKLTLIFFLNLKSRKKLKHEDHKEPQRITKQNSKNPLCVFVELRAFVFLYLQLFELSENYRVGEQLHHARPKVPKVWVIGK